MRDYLPTISMGGTCSKIVFAKTSTIFKNRVHTATLPQNRPEKVEGNQINNIVHDDPEDKHLNKVIVEKKTVELEPSDIFSKGDHNIDNTKQIEVNTIWTDQRTLIKNNFARGDCALDEKSEEKNNCYQMIQVEKELDNHGASPDGDESQTVAIQDCEKTAKNVTRDSNDNSYIRIPSDSQEKYNLDLDFNNDEIKNTNEPLGPRGATTPGDKEQDDAVEGTEEFSAVPQDSLFFLPLDSDKQLTPAAPRIPQRLNRSRKPPLSYSERMLLADCNRFQQLDKKREFAVRRNRSISRIGRLPKIDDPKRDSSEANVKDNNNLNKPDD